MSEKLLSIKDLRIEYRTDIEVVEAVNGITLEVDRGETLGLVGETGAGKTTTALSIMGLLPERTAHITSGSIEFDGKDLLTMSEEDLRYQIRGEKIAMIFQDPMTSLNPVMTVGFQIAEAIRYHSDHMSKEQIEARVDEIAEEIVKVIDESGIKLGNWSNIYLTGGGLSFNRGGKDYLSGKLEKPVRDTPKRTTKLNSHAFSSALGLMDLIIDTIEHQNQPSNGIGGKIKGFFRSLLGG